MRLCASCHQVAGAFAQPDVGFPADVLDHRGLLVEAQLQMTADLGGRAGGPGACHKRSSGMGVPSFGDRALGASLPGGRCRRDQPQALHQCSWGGKPGQVANVGDHGDGHRAWHATERLEGFDHRVHTPGVHVRLELLVETLEACSVFGDRTDLCLEDDGLRRRRADDLGEPPEMGRAPMGPAGGADIVAEQEGLEANRGVLAIAESIFTGAGEIAHGFIVHGGDIHDSESPRACQPGQLHGVSAVGFDAVTSLFGHK
jgi:hypothetical protein